jgi:hypothetical protein
MCVVVVVVGCCESRLVPLTEVDTEELDGDKGDLEAGEETDKDREGAQGREAPSQRSDMLVVTSSNFDASPRSLRDGICSESFSVAPARALTTAEVNLGEASPATRASCMDAETECATVIVSAKQVCARRQCHVDA